MVKVSDLLKEQDEKRRQKEKTFKKIYKIVEKKIIIANTGGNSQMWFEIPEFILGVPVYKVLECKDYLIKKLENDGFKVTFYEPNNLYVDWKEEDD